MKKVTLICKDGKKLTDTSIKGILKDSQLKDLRPKNILIKIQHGNDNNFRFELSTIDEGTLRYQLNGYDDEILDEAKYAIDKWVDKNKPNKILQFWSTQSLAGLLGLGIFIMGLTLLPQKEESTTQDQLKSQAHEIIKQGVSKENQERAVEILLKLQSGYVPENYQAKVIYPSSQKIRIFVILCVVFVFSLIKPLTTIGVGKSKGYLDFYKFWKKFVLVSLPATFIIPYIIGYIKSFLYP